MSKILGIDLGTTNSLAAHLADDRPRLIPNSLGQILTPSVVGIDLDGNVLVGQAARELQVMHPDRCACLFKRYMGTDWKARLPGHEFSAEELSSLVLRSLKDDALACFGEPVERAVITVPAYFNDQQRQATIRAGRIAGFQVERIFNEPTAAAVAYGFHESRKDKLLLIVDLGGGTFDVSLVEIFDGTMEVRASSGEGFLGGEDFTRALAGRVLFSLGMPYERTELEAPHLVSRMIQQCEIAKCRLSSQECASVRVPDKDGVFPENAPRVTVTRQQFEEWTQHILGRIELPIRRILGDARVRRDDIQEIILVGGATRMPGFIARIADLLGKEPEHRINPDEVVALGAAVQAGLIGGAAGVEDLVVTDVAPFTLGVEIMKRFGHERREGYFLPVIERNSTIPVSQVERVTTIVPNQTNILVKIYQGEGRRVEENLYLGEFEVTGIPRGPAGQEVDIRFTYDLNGVLEVEATIVATQKQVSHVIARYAHGLSPEKLQQAIADMAQLKLHPRDDAVNRLLIRRAERVYAELSQREREVLGQMLDGFEEALGLRDQEAIARFRETLEEFLDQFDSDPGPDAKEDR
jgi:molecular chaperone HscC